MAMVAAMVAAASAAVAATGDVTLKSYSVGEYRSRPGETLDQFALRSGEALHAFSRRTQFEACGWIAATPDHSQFQLSAFTVRSHIGCGSDEAEIPAGFISMALRIHSHPTEEQLQINQVDAAILRASGNARRPLTHGMAVSVTPDAFSAGDYQRPGYLAASNGVWFQNGAGTDRFVGPYVEASR